MTKHDEIIKVLEKFRLETLQAIGKDFDKSDAFIHLPPPYTIATAIEKIYKPLNEAEVVKIIQTMYEKEFNTEWGMVYCEFFSRVVKAICKLQSDIKYLDRAEVEKEFKVLKSMCYREQIAQIGVVEIVMNNILKLAIPQSYIYNTEKGTMIPVSGKEELREGMTEKEFWFKSSEGHRKSATKYLNKYLNQKKEIEELEDIIVNLELLEDIKDKKISKLKAEIDRLQKPKCKECGGTGIVPSGYYGTSKDDVCRRCDGTGIAKY